MLCPCEAIVSAAQGGCICATLVCFRRLSQICNGWTKHACTIYSLSQHERAAANSTLASRRKNVISVTYACLGGAAKQRLALAKSSETPTHGKGLRRAKEAVEAATTPTISGGSGLPICATVISVWQSCPFRVHSGRWTRVWVGRQQFKKIGQLRSTSVASGGGCSREAASKRTSAARRIPG